MLAISGCVHGKERKKLEEESMKLKGSRGDACLRSSFMVARRLAVTQMLDIFHDAGLGYWYFVSSDLDKIVNLTNLAILDCSFNHFGGELHLNLGKLSELKFVTFDFNNLEGDLPPSLMNCTNLVELHLGNNNLRGDISLLDFSGLSQLTKLDLRINNFTSTVPVSLYSCRSLKAIRLTWNHLEGQIQVEIISLKSLSFLSLGYNQFTNLTGAMKILMSCGSLHALLLSGSFVGEGMPSDDDMVDFDGFQNLRLLGLVLFDLTGQIPLWLSKLKNLEILALGFNQITGQIPSWLGTLPRLFTQPNFR
ncbi:hypothetical protein Pyn_05072 [Prunus yedoensis var. nudiflora]|uniref:Uncharacterized protein n=1 Tax=Prunus yedoensis var. nudiflora TaxID=2094558 RepID=A0A314UG43_PRUYE|nr:hypothetical protein Pyn_05072 [Prunus yedoensis var. nudiflora]